MKKRVLSFLLMAVVIGLVATSTYAQTPKEIVTKLEKKVKVKGWKLKRVVVDKRSIVTEDTALMLWKSRKGYFVDVRIHVHESVDVAEKELKRIPSLLASGVVTKVSRIGDEAIMVTSGYSRDVSASIYFRKGKVQVNVRGAPNKKTARTFAKQIAAQLE